jgi:hypothetical protein
VLLYSLLHYCFDILIHRGIFSFIFVVAGTRKQTVVERFWQVTFFFFHTTYELGMALLTYNIPWSGVDLVHNMVE